MISRHFGETEYVHAFDLETYSPCNSVEVTACGTVDTGGALQFSFGGRIIDRLGLGRGYRGMQPVIAAHGTPGTSAFLTCTIKYLGVAWGVQHSSTTCSADFNDFSTADWPAEKALWVMTTSTTTGGATGLYSSEHRNISSFNGGFLSTAPTTSTSTGYAVYVAGKENQGIQLDGAQRYLRLIVLPRIESTAGACTCALTLGVAAGIVFGDPDESPAAVPRGRIHVTSGCST